MCRSADRELVELLEVQGVDEALDVRPQVGDAGLFRLLVAPSDSITASKCAVKFEFSG